jgi:hypothetical protein
MSFFTQPTSKMKSGHARTQSPILQPAWPMRSMTFERGAQGAAAAVLVLALAVPADAQETREELLAARCAEKAARLHRHGPTSLERGIVMVERAVDVFSKKSW